MKTIIICFSLMSGILASYSVLGQQFPTHGGQSADPELQDKKSYFQIGSSYVSDNVYLGRKDSVTLPYISPAIGYFAKSGFFTGASMGLSPKSAAGLIDLFSVDMGYSFNAGNYEGELTGTKYFYSSQSTNVKSELKEDIQYASAFDFGFIKPSLVATLNIGNKLDYAVTIGLEHSFEFFDEKLGVTPTALMNASTQNYYDQYYRKRRYSAKRLAKLATKGIDNITGVVKNASEFKPLDYELSLPLNYESGRFMFSASPGLIIPVNAADVTLTTHFKNGSVNTRDFTEKISNTFLATLEIGYKF